MKRQGIKWLVFGIAVITCTAISWSCKKYTYDEALPQVQFVSAKTNGGDSVILTAQVTNPGASPIENVGFAYAEQPYFDITVNQVLANPAFSVFNVIVKAVPDSTYYFKCFATNSYGYKASANYVYVMPAASPQTAPCTGTVKANTVIDNGNTFSISGASLNVSTSGYGSMEIDCPSGFNGNIVTIYFNATPVNGIYKTVDINNLSGDTDSFACAIMDYNFNSVDPGANVYIAIGTGGKGVVSYCSAFFSGPGYYTSGNVTY